MKKIILLAICATLLTGCAYLKANPQATTRIATGVSVAAYVGTTETLRDHPEYRSGFQLAVTDLKILESGPVDTIKLLEIVNRLPVKELKSSRANMIITAATIILNDEIGATPLEKLDDLKPVITAIRQGIERGLNN
jgi:hypothetical protein